MLSVAKVAENKLLELIRQFSTNSSKVEGATYTPGISESRSGVSSFYGLDRLGSKTLQTSSVSAVIYQVSYDAFGNQKSSSGATSSPFGFVGAEGYQQDSDSGLMLLGHRYYDSSTGCFLTRDPVKDGGNWHDYCKNNPLTQPDPSGLVTIFGFEFTLQVVLDGSKTGVGGVSSTFGGPDLGQSVQPGFGGSKDIAIVALACLALADDGATADERGLGGLSGDLDTSHPVLDETVPKKGPPGATFIGPKTSRRYGPDGNREVDSDYGAFGGEGSDHGHDLHPAPGDFPDRSGPRPPKAGDPPPPGSSPKSPYSNPSSSMAGIITNRGILYQ